ncbi:class I SAM-dependent methyltransferase [Polymorphum gilvum]|uniref:class I SAM-dependent methyltransferase n=1 Tax=Polymorphum gilvum TaxID=991904 RepID=UPI0013051605|nr:methyltransferase domain-containing protein [Polymorphum gilvum]
MSKLRPDILIVNFYPSTMPWLTPDVLKEVTATKFIVVHELTNRQANHLFIEGYDFYLCADPIMVPYNAQVVPVPRFAPAVNEAAEPAFDIPTFGSFGFATENKGFDVLCSRVATEFERARIRINIPHHDDPAIVTEDARNAIIEKCRQALEGTAIELDVSEHFFDDEGLLAFCAENHLNILAYTGDNDRGISSCADILLASGRPFLVSDSVMFRHMHQYQPTVRLSQTTLRKGMETDPQAFRIARRELHPLYASARWVDAILDAVDRKALLASVPDRPSFNKVLDDQSREAYAPVIQEMWDAVPEIMERKIAEANVQQAFVLDAVRRLATRYTCPRILAVGAFEDTACEVLKRNGYRVTAIDPVLDLSLNDFYLLESTALESFDLILSTSVLEHVDDHIQFVRQCADLLQPGGVLVLTVDFKDSYTDGDPKPSVDHRLYTGHMFRADIMGCLPDCRLFNEGSWEGAQPDFTYEGVDYNFASLVIEKMHGNRFYWDAEHFDYGAGNAWRRFAAHAADAGGQSQDVVTAFGQAQGRRFLEADDVARLVAAGRLEPEHRARIHALELQLEQARSEGDALKGTLDQVNRALKSPKFMIKNLCRTLIGKPTRF